MQPTFDVDILKFAKDHFHSTRREGISLLPQNNMNYETYAVGRLIADARTYHPTVFPNPSPNPSPSALRALSLSLAVC